MFQQLITCLTCLTKEIGISSLTDIPILTAVCVSVNTTLDKYASIFIRRNHGLNLSSFSLSVSLSLSLSLFNMT